MTKTPPSLSLLKSQRVPLENPHIVLRRRLTRVQKFAVWITSRIGTMGFFFIIVTWTLCWLGWNLLAPIELRFDPPMGFVLWLFISNLIQIFLMPLIMVGQNIQGAQSEARAQHDLDVNIKAEHEIEVVLTHLEYQNSLLLAIVEKIGLDVAKIERHERK